MTKDMTTGSPLRIILLFSIPVLLGNLFQQFYNMVDTIIVGRYLGEEALAAVGSTGCLMFLVLGFANGIAQGFGVMVSHAFGAKDFKLLRHYVALSLILTLIISLLLTIPTVTASRLLLAWMHTPENIIAMADAYIKVIFAGILLTMAYNVLSGILRGIGDSRTPLYFLILSSVLNIILDVVLIVYTGLGTAGAAYATIIAQGVSAVLCFFYMYRKYDILRTRHEDYYLDSAGVKNMLAIGVPMALNYSITAIGTMIMQSAVNVFGSSVVAAFTAASKVSNIATQSMPTLGTAMATYCGQNYGAGEVGRIREGMRKSLLVVLLYSVIGFFIAAFAGQYIALLFLDARETEILGYVQQFLFVNGLFYPVLGILFVIRNSLQGLGFSVPAMAAGLCELVARTVVAFCFVTAFGYNAVCFANPAAWSAAVMLLIPLYFWGMRRLRRDKAVYDRLKEDIDERQS